MEEVVANPAVMDMAAIIGNLGVAMAVAGAILAVMFGCMGSSKGIAAAASQAAGVMSEKPELFGKLLVLAVLPGTQGFYGLICAILMARSIGLMAGEVKCSPIVGLGLLAVGACTGIALMWSAMFQGETSAASINLTAKKPEEGGRALLLPALVETYAVVALLTSILLIGWIVKTQG